MEQKFPITKERVRNAWTYSRWVVLLIIVLSLGGCNLFYQITAYRVPDEKKVEFYIDQYGTGGNEAFEGLLETIRQEALPELEEITYRFMGLDDTYGPMQLTTWISAGEGNVFLLTEEYFRSLAQTGALTPLQPLIDSGALHVPEVDLATGYDTDTETGESLLYGIPAEALPGLADYGVYPQGYLCLVVQTDVELEHSERFLDYLLTHLQTAQPTEAAEPAA